MSEKKHPESTTEMANEIIRMLYESTKELAAKEDKTLAEHEQIRRNGEALVALYANVWC